MQTKYKTAFNSAVEEKMAEKLKQVSANAKTPSEREKELQASLERCVCCCSHDIYLCVLLGGSVSFFAARKLNSRVSNKQ